MNEQGVIKRHSRILIADDDPMIRSIFENGLVEAGYKVMVAGDGHEAIKLGLGYPPDLAVLDVLMPGATGIEVAQQLHREIGTYSIILSALTDNTVVEAATEKAVFSYLIKPITTQQLIPAVEAGLKRAAEMKELGRNHEQMGYALQNSRLICKAVGIIMERFQLEEDEAFDIFRQYARSCRHKLVDLAEKMVISRDGRNTLLADIERTIQNDHRPVVL